MNEVSVKVEDFPKDESNCPDLGAEHNEVDPLALETDVKKELDPLGGEAQEVHRHISDDSTAKEETLCEDQGTLYVQENNVKDELELQEDKKIVNDVQESVEELVSIKSDSEETKNETEVQKTEFEKVDVHKADEPEVEKATETTLIEVKKDIPQSKEESMSKEVNVDVEMRNILNGKESQTTEAPKIQTQAVNGMLSKLMSGMHCNASSNVSPIPGIPFPVQVPLPSRNIPKLQPGNVANTSPKFHRNRMISLGIPGPVSIPTNIINAKEETTKRPANDEIETESPLKRLCQEVEKTFPQHDAMVTDYIQNVTKNNVDEIQRHTEQLLAEIQTLRELAQKKELEWNNILHLKKVKEEILLRLLRRKQVLSYEKSAENGPDKNESLDYHNQTKSLAIDKSDEISGLALKPPVSSIGAMMQPQMLPVSSHFTPMAGMPPPYDKAAHMHSMSKPVYPQPLMMPGPGMTGFPREMNGQLANSYNLTMGRQGPTKDVKSIIADYRQRNPDMNPRRGRRMKSILNPNMMSPNRPMAPKMDNLNNLGMMFNNIDMTQKAMLERLSQVQAGGLPNGLTFKDVLVQFASMQHQAGFHGIRPPDSAPSGRGRRTERASHAEDAAAATSKADTGAGAGARLPPPPYPEISLVPVGGQHQDQPQNNSLLHGILTKNCGEITITPVQPQPEPPPAPPANVSALASAAAAPAARDKPDREDVVQLEDSESPRSEGSAEGEAGRLVIDEGGAGAGAGDGDAPLCQGCRRRDAQFVCAGCANQWYCSRDCQVAAWDDHSEMCSG